MVHKKDLRKQRTGTIINLRSKKQEQHLGPALRYVKDKIINHLK